MVKKYILFPRNHKKPVKVIKRMPRPKLDSKAGYGFAEGGFGTNKEVCNRIGQLHGKMNKEWQNKCKKYN